MSQFIGYPSGYGSGNGSGNSSISGSSLTMKQAIYHDASSTGINNNSGAFVQFSGATLTSDVKKIEYSNTSGYPLDVRLGADASSAALASTLFIMNRGEGPISLDCEIPTGSKLWVRSKTTDAITDGIITINLMG